MPTLAVSKAMKTIILSTLIFIGMMGIFIAIETNNYGLFATNGLMVSIIFMHDIFHRNVKR
jgi:hypothetical protein